MRIGVIRTSVVLYEKNLSLVKRELGNRTFSRSIRLALPLPVDVNRETENVQHWVDTGLTTMYSLVRPFRPIPQIDFPFPVF